jgi:hypothetical protein
VNTELTPYALVVSNEGVFRLNTSPTSSTDGTRNTAMVTALNDEGGSLGICFVYELLESVKAFPDVIKAEQALVNHAALMIGGTAAAVEMFSVQFAGNRFSAKSRKPHEVYKPSSQCLGT